MFGNGTVVKTKLTQPDVTASKIIKQQKCALN